MRMEYGTLTILGARRGQPMGREIGGNAAPTEKSEKVIKSLLTKSDACGIL